MAVIFNEPTSTPNRSGRGRTTSLAGVIIKMGLARTNTGAQVIMFVIAVLALGALVFTTPWLTKSPPPPVVETSR